MILIVMCRDVFFGDATIRAGVKGGEVQFSDGEVVVNEFCALSVFLQWKIFEAFFIGDPINCFISFVIPFIFFHYIFFAVSI